VFKQLLVASCLLVAIGMPARASAQVSDERLATAVITAIRGVSTLTIFDDVTVTVSDRTVTLTGAVTAPYKRDDIAARVARVDGARAVTNNIRVLPVSSSDAALRVRIAQAIYTNPAFWQYASMACPPIHIIVEHGRVELTGVVNNETERTLAYALAQVDGALSVRNDLKRDAR
jgi:hyperosmotically inducible protein